MIFASDGAIARASTTAVGSRSIRGVQVSPASSVLQTPASAAPKKKVSGWSGTPTAQLLHPPRNGPRLRQERPEYRLGSAGCAQSASVPETKRDRAVGIDRFIFGSSRLRSSIASVQ